MDKNKKNEAACEKELKKAEASAERAKEKLEESSEKLEKCEGEASQWEKKAAEYYDQLLRLKADFENFRKRTEKEKPELIKWGKNELILKIFPLYDILLSAHEHLAGVDPQKCAPGQIEEVLKGLEMIFKEFSKFFEGEGIRPMELLNKPYDPMKCEIIGIDQGTEENDGLITEVFQKGYMLEDKVLRPAKVKIAKKTQPEQQKS
ncbi:MAG: nucleotide exchange factor GrpE [Elusimicrobiota bacterium]